jgi:hypothetical protein
MRQCAPALQCALRAGHHALERGDLGLVFLKKISRSGVFIERAGLKLLDPDSD